MPKVSVIVPIYNVEKYLNRCVDSILAQTWSDFELILIDDGSSDRSGVICDEYAQKDGRVRVIHKENGGVSSARNAGLDAAEGELVAFVDSDDWIHYQYLEILVRAIHESDADMATLGITRVTNIVGRGGISYDNISQTVHFAREIRKDIYRYIYQPSLENVLTCGLYSLVKANVFTNIRFVDEIRVAEDIEVMVRLAAFIKKTVHLDIPLYYYRCNNASLSRSELNTSTLSSILTEDLIVQYLREEHNLEVKKFEYRLFCDYFDLQYKVINSNRKDLKEYFMRYKEILQKNSASLIRNSYMTIVDRLLLLSYLKRFNWWIYFFAKGERVRTKRLQSFLDI